MFTGESDISAGLLFLTLFMLYGFFLIYGRDFSLEKKPWIAGHGVGTHFESRLSHAHGNLFALLNIGVGLVLSRMSLPSAATYWISGLALAGMFMPLGILAEVLFGASSIVVIGSGLSMSLAMGQLTFAVWQLEKNS
ncbi:hypothetical protein [Pseudooceanicola sp.]|uniref:hypothetical protein n=1 Tax=Pseudooceanicola sp. TaxID=1914328 RepID=UPI002616B563|nr:hypothetical protein [Pseudooceanicola sp.]MDF1856504.1 hypothetical protein [Pseudooceanicola sp.]